MDAQTLVIAGIIAGSLALLLWLPARKRWNADGEVDEARESLEEE